MLVDISFKPVQLAISVVLIDEDVCSETTSPELPPSREGADPFYYKSSCVPISPYIKRHFNPSSRLSTIHPAVGQTDHATVKYVGISGITKAMPPNDGYSDSG